jgi:hypothetical protein
VWNGPGYVHFTTSTYQHNHGDNWNVVGNIDFKSDLAAGNWIYIYFGYNRNSKSCSAYLKFPDRENTLRFDNIRHMTPRLFKVYLGKDQWHSGTNGVIRDFRFAYGPGSYRETDFDQLHSVQQKIKIRTEFTEPNKVQEEYINYELKHQENFKF